MLEEIKCKVLSYCDFPKEMLDNLDEDSFEDYPPDCYIKYDITSRKKQVKYDDDFTLTNWIIERYPELEGKSVLIHIDY